MDVTDSLDLDPVSLTSMDSYTYRGRLLGGTEVAIEKVQDDISHERMKEVLAIWAKCSHPNIVQLIGKARFRGQPATVYEWHEHEDIYEYLKHHPTIDRYQLSAQISEGVAYLHANGIIHGDLHGGQILVSSDGVPRIQLSMRTSSTTIHPAEYDWGLWTQAPELRNSGDKYSLASDIFTLGMTILEIITWHELDDLDDLEDVSGAVAEGQLPSRPTNVIPMNDAGNVIWDILCKCWSFMPENRPSAKHVCDVISSVYQFPDGPAFKSPRLVVRKDTTVQDLITHFEKRGLTNYTEMFHSADVISTVSVADTALANVYRVELTSHQPIAVKYVKHNTPYKRLKRAARELDCWSSYQHQNILPVFGFAVIGGDLTMVSPWMRNGCITGYVTSHPYCDRLLLCVQLAQAIAYLHENNVVHGDIKGPNVLVSDFGTVQVTDFGVSIADHQEIEFSLTSSGRGTERWQAPEILQAYTDSTMEADVYALGMTLIEVYTGEPPYGAVNWLQVRIPVITGQMRPSRPISLPINEIGNGLWGLMNWCWAGDPKERQTSGWVYQWLQYYASINTQMEVQH